MTTNQTPAPAIDSILNRFKSESTKVFLSQNQIARATRKEIVDAQNQHAALLAVAVSAQNASDVHQCHSNFSEVERGKIQQALKSALVQLAAVRG